MDDYRGDVYLHRGLTDLTEGLTRGLEQRKHDAQLTKSLRQTLSLIDPKGKDNYTMMGSAQLDGALRAFMIQQEQAEQNRRGQELGMRLRQMQAQEQSQQANRLALQDTARYMSPEQTGSPLGQYIQSVANAGADVDPALMRVLQETQPDPSRIPQFGTHTVPETGATFATYGNIMSPAGYARRPDESVSGLKSLVAPDGSVLGFMHRNTRGHETFIKAPAEHGLKTVRDETGATVPGVYMDAAGKTHDLRTKLQKEGTAEAPAEAEQPGWWARLFGAKSDKPEETKEQLYSTEAEARAAGKKKGDEIRIKGVGKVRLK